MPDQASDVADASITTTAAGGSPLLVAGRAERRSDAARTTRRLAALQQAIRLDPDERRLRSPGAAHDDADRKVTWLGQAAALSPQSASADGSRLRAGRASAVRPTRSPRSRRLRSLDPSNTKVHVELGTPTRVVGNLPAARAFERAWSADRRNVAAAQELVYIKQRLGRNARRRGSTRRPSSTSVRRATTARVAGDTQFGLQRLHEDLGRRVTVSFDGWSGTHVGTGTSASRAGRRVPKLLAGRSRRPARRQHGSQRQDDCRLRPHDWRQRQRSPRAAGAQQHAWRRAALEAVRLACVLRRGEQQERLDGPELHDTLVRAKRIALQWRPLRRRLARVGPAAGSRRICISTPRTTCAPTTAP
jgi:hypothetical protein